MKKLIILLLILSNSYAWSQATAKDTTDNAKQIFWKMNIVPMMELNATKIIELTHFPLESGWENQFEAWEATEEELKKLYEDRISDVFDVLVRDALKRESPKSIRVVKVDDNYEFQLVYTRLEDEGYGVVIDYYYRMDFKKFDDNWMLTGIFFVDPSGERL